MDKKLIDFNGTMFPPNNRAVIMAGISEKQNERVFYEFIPISVIKNCCRLNSWTVGEKENGNTVIRFENGRERDLTALIEKGNDLEPYDIRNNRFKTMIKVSLSATGKMFRDVLYNAFPEKEENSERKLVNFLYNFEPYNISCFESLVCVLERMWYKTTLVYVIPDIAVVKEENERARRVYKSGILRERIKKSINTLLQLQERKDLVRFFDEIWIVLANSRVQNDHSDYMRFTEIRKVKNEGESEMRMNDEIVAVLEKQLEVCNDDLEWFEAAAVKISGGRDFLIKR